MGEGGGGVRMPPDSATLSSAVHVERAMPPPTKLHIAILPPPPPLAQILKETLIYIYITLAIDNVVICSSCSLASMELILTPNYSLLHLHSNYRNSFKFILEDFIAINSVLNGSTTRPIEFVIKENKKTQSPSSHSW